MAPASARASPLLLSKTTTNRAKPWLTYQYAHLYLSLNHPSAHQSCTALGYEKSRTSLQDRRTPLQEIPHFVTSTPHPIPRTPALHFKEARTPLQRTYPYLIYFLSFTERQVVSIFALIIRSQPTSSLQVSLAHNQTILLSKYPFRTWLQANPNYPFYSQPFANLNAHDACLLLFPTWNTTYYQRKVNR